MKKTSKIYIAGHSGLVGSAIKRRLESAGYENLLLRRHRELDLCDQAKVDEFFKGERPEYVFMAAAMVGGIMANSTYPAEFIYNNLAIELNIIHSAYKYGVKKLLFLGSSCIYPRNCPQPMREEHLLSGYLEPTNEPYAVAKIAGIKMCQAYNRQYGTNFISAMPTNIYGPGDNFDLETSHALPALIRKFHEAKIKDETRSGNLRSSVTVWGTGAPEREFLYVDDLADACVFLMESFNVSAEASLLNVGVGKVISIGELSHLIKDIVGYKGKIVFDKTKPDGTPKKLLDVSKINALGWKAKTALREGIEETYRWYRQKTGTQIPR